MEFPLIKDFSVTYETFNLDMVVFEELDFPSFPWNCDFNHDCISNSIQPIIDFLFFQPIKKRQQSIHHYAPFLLLFQHI